MLTRQIAINCVQPFTMDFDSAHIGNQRTPGTVVRNRFLKNIALVCLLSFATLWLGTTTAAHIHLEEHPLHCDICLSSSSGDGIPSVDIPTLSVEVISSVATVFSDNKPQLIPAAPLNSRAPPYNL